MPRSPRKLFFDGPPDEIRRSMGSRDDEQPPMGKCSGTIRELVMASDRVVECRIDGRIDVILRAGLVWRPMDDDHSEPGIQLYANGAVAAAEFVTMRRFYDDLAIDDRGVAAIEPPSAPADVVVDRIGTLETAIRDARMKSHLEASGRHTRTRYAKHPARRKASVPSATSSASYWAPRCTI
jgi:hypothetical protein